MQTRRRVRSCSVASAAPSATHRTSATWTGSIVTCCCTAWARTWSAADPTASLPSHYPTGPTTARRRASGGRRRCGASPTPPPYMHDGRAPTLADAVQLHGGQARGREPITSNSARQISFDSSLSSRPCVRRDNQVHLWMRQAPPRWRRNGPYAASAAGAAGRSWASRRWSRPWSAANGR